MTEPNREFVEQISKKIEAGDADGATYLAFVVLTQVVPGAGADRSCDKP